jgi:hypothetical protein
VDLEVHEPAAAQPPPGTAAAPAIPAPEAPHTAVSAAAAAPTLGATPSRPFAGPIEAPRERPLTAATWIGAAATVALGAAAATTGALALGKHADLQAALAEVPQPSSVGDLRSQTRTLGVATDALLGATAVAAVATLVLTLTRPRPAARAEALGLHSGAAGLAVSF